MQGRECFSPACPGETSFTLSSHMPPCCRSAWSHMGSRAWRLNSLADSDLRGAQTHPVPPNHGLWVPRSHPKEVVGWRRVSSAREEHPGPSSAACARGEAARGPCCHLFPPWLGSPLAPTSPFCRVLRLFTCQMRLTCHAMYFQWVEKHKDILP